MKAKTEKCVATWFWDVEGDLHVLMFFFFKSIYEGIPCKYNRVRAVLFVSSDFQWYICAHRKSDGGCWRKEGRESWTLPEQNRQIQTHHKGQSQNQRSNGSSALPQSHRYVRKDNSPENVFSQLTLLSERWTVIKKKKKTANTEILSPTHSSFSSASSK